MYRVYVDGVFDLFHYGHAEMLERVHKAFAPIPIYVIAGPCSDEDCEAYKRKPILSLQERIRSLTSCRYVNQVVDDAPWIITQSFLDKHNIDFVCHDGDPYPSEGIDDVYEYVKNIGIFRSIERTKGISTTDIINRVKSRFDQ